MSLSPLRKLSARFFAPVALAAMAWASPAARAIVIDGQISDWDGVGAIPVSGRSAQLESKYCGIESLKVTTDDDFIYALVTFSEPRPFADGPRQSRLAEGFWDDFTYLELDVNGDGQWDYRTRMTRGKRYGQNNLIILRSTGDGQEGRAFLREEGHKDYVPLGPRAFFTPDGKAVEMRVPRAPLRLSQGQILFRALVHCRDASGSTGRWATEYFPAGGQWLGLKLNPAPPRGNPEPGAPAGPDALTANRQLEPVQLRDDLEPNAEGKTTRSPYAIPRVKEIPFITARQSKKDEPAPRRPDPVRAMPVLIVGPEGSAPGQGTEIPEIGPSATAPAPTSIPTPLPTPPGSTPPPAPMKKKAK